MLYIYLDTHQIKILNLKKSLLGSYDASFYSKTFDVELLTDGKPANIDVIDSAVKNYDLKINDQVENYKLLHQADHSIEKCYSTQP